MASPFRFGDNNSSFDYDPTLQRLCSLLERMIDEQKRTNDNLSALCEVARDIKDYVRSDSNMRLNDFGS